MLSIAGAYFGDDASNKMLTRVYGHAFADKAQMEEHRKNLEEAARRDHRRLGKDLDLFSTMGELGAGLVLWHPKGGFVRHKIEEFWRNEHLKGGYDIVYSPHVARSSALWSRSSTTISPVHPAVPAPTNVAANKSRFQFAFIDSSSRFGSCESSSHVGEGPRRPLRSSLCAPPSHRGFCRSQGGLDRTLEHSSTPPPDTDLPWTTTDLTK